MMPQFLKLDAKTPHFSLSHTCPPAVQVDAAQKQLEAVQATARVMRLSHATWAPLGALHARADLTPLQVKAQLQGGELEVQPPKSKCQGLKQQRGGLSCTFAELQGGETQPPWHLHLLCKSTVCILVCFYV